MSLGPFMFVFTLKYRELLGLPVRCWATINEAGQFEHQI